MESISQITITINTFYPEQYFEERIAQPVQMKFPWVKLIYASEEPFFNNNIEKWRSTNTSPDILLMFGPRFEMPQIIKNNFQYDLNDLIRENQFDLSQFDSTAFNQILCFGNNGEVFALPYNKTDHPLFYNKDIFDKFGVSYPHNGMNWDETIELTKKVTGEIDGVFYRGLDIADYVLLREQLSLTCLDPVTDYAIVNNEKWKLLAETIKDIYTIHGNLPDPQKLFKFNSGFSRDKNVAMAVICANCLNEPEINWDIVSYPTFRQYPLIKPTAPNSSFLILSPFSNNKKVAFEIISYLVSEEHQLYNSKKGEVSSLNQSVINDAYASELPHFKDKNIKALFVNVGATPVVGKSIFEQEVVGYVKDSFIKMVLENKDVGSTLQELELTINNAVGKLKEKLYA
ncbi:MULTISPECIES: extracellular solute-binding protein [unclassified Paenibacillus]|uniref:extracellular solute-binding protein n=1 Tax=unclassified Paenibacillus TaxID=185978 RepID=UPI0027846EB8|nr:MULTISPECIES: extracellular solute-binding protein [unclassified Paenibacillus]MDQ0899354.1 multiple sugar transport system substrate-binding protein [Paenibacillus sp. V4I7]MDQ0914667.1 multiple sugar transport system substrate-binding protein [Paenibacillus sp. V4I5]